jgi:hypothetical protein
MALNFPDSPTLNQVYTDNTSGFSYQWNGTVWISFSAASSSQIKTLDDISGSFNNSTLTFALTSSSVSITPPTPQSLIINLGGVIQDPTDDYSVSGSNIVFSTAPANGLSFSGISLGPAIPVTVVTIPDGTVTDGSLRISTTAVVGSATTFTEDLVVSGDARVTGILTVGTSSITLNGTSNIINVGTGLTLNGTSNIINVGTGLTLSSSGINVTGVITATSFSGNGSGLTGAGSTVFNDTTTNQEFFPLFTSTTTGTITASGISTSKLTYNPSTGALTVVDINSTSDIKLKENIKTVENSLDTLTQLRGVSFDWKETGKGSYGVIAQELEEILPDLVKNGEVKSVNYNGLIGVLIEAVKELKREVQELKKH